MPVWTSPCGSMRRSREIGLTARRCVQAREMIIKGSLFNILEDADEVERIFAIIKQQREY